MFAPSIIPTKHAEPNKINEKRLRDCQVFPLSGKNKKKIYFFLLVNTKNISSHLLKILAILLVLPICEITDIFSTFDDTVVYTFCIILSQYNLKDFEVSLVLMSFHSRNISQSSATDVMKKLCACIHKTDDKTTCTRALWCLGKQNIAADIVKELVSD